jgi:hypothetical protein
VILGTLVERTHYAVIFWSTAAAIVTAALGWWLGRRLSKVPGARQAAAELLVASLTRACGGARAGGRPGLCVALFGTLALWAITSNVLGVVPLRHLGLGLISAGGVEIGGEKFRDFNDDGVWQPGEPVLRGGVADWKSRGRRHGFLIPSVYGPSTGANILLQLSLCLALAAGAVLAVPLWIRGIRGEMKARRWYGIFAATVRCGPRSIRSAATLWAEPFGGALPAIVVGVGAYGVLSVSGVTFMAEIVTGLLEILIVAGVFARRRADARLAPKPVGATG